MDYDVSDILGGGTLPIGRNQPPSLWSTIPDFAKKSLYAVCCLISVVVVRDLYFRFLRWRERSYRKATRRRHGIPDSDQRPFNVAYAAAVNARQEREAQSKVGLRIRTIAPITAQPDSRQNPKDFVATVPGGLSSYPLRGPSANPRSRNNTGAFGRYDVPPIVISSPSPSAPGSAGVGPNRTPGFVDFPQVHNRSHKSSKTYIPLSIRPSKHGLDGDAYSETERDTNKKSRVGDDDDDLTNQEDGDMEGIESEVPAHPKRGSKRLASPDDDNIGGDLQTGRLEKRARKVSGDHTPAQRLDETMEDVDILSDSMHSPRGKKRDRVDDGSTFGGDEDSFLGDPDEKHRRRRRRRTVSSKKHPRGQKRGRDLQTVESESEEELDQSVMRRSRKKRGKQTISSEEEDAYMDVPVSLDPLCKGRAIGEKWELNGTRYKVGPNGDRMRQTLVKRNRPKYPMPVDSEHPDKDVMIEVIVETWLTEDEYRIAKDRFELAWQDSPRSGAPDPETPLRIQTPAKGGKNLLWSSTTSHPDSPVTDRRPFRQSITTNIGLQLNPFHQSQYTGKGRITGSVYSPIAGNPDTPKLKHAKSYSKWEKQDLEAEAMSKIRQKLQEQKKAVEEQNKPAVLPISAPIQPTSSTTSTLLFGQPSDKPADAKGATPPGSNTTPTGPSVKEPVKSFTFGPAKDINAAPSGTTSSLFGKPPTPSVMTPSTSNPPAPAPASSIPNFFAPKSSSNPPASTPAAPQPATISLPPSFGVSNPSKPSFSFPASNTSPFGAPAEQPKKAEPTSMSVNGSSSLRKVEQPAKLTTNPTPNPLPAVAGGATPLFPFTSSGAAPSIDTNQAKFAFGAENKSSSPAPILTTSATSAFGTIQTSQQQTLTPFGTQQVAQNSQPKFGFGFTASSQPKADTGTNGTLTTPKPFGSFGGASNPFQSTTPSSTSSTNAFSGSGSTDAKPSEAPKPAFSFGISPVPNSTNVAAASPASSSMPFGNSATTASPSVTNPTLGSISAAPSKPIFSFSTSNSTGNTGQQPPQSNPTFTFGMNNSSSPTSGGPQSGAVTPSSFGFGTSSSQFNFGKPEEKK